MDEVLGDELGRMSQVGFKLASGMQRPAGWIGGQMRGVKMKEKLVLSLVVLLADLLSVLLITKNPVGGGGGDRSSSEWQLDHNHCHQPEDEQSQIVTFPKSQHNWKSASFLLVADAKGVAGLGKAGGDSTGGSDKAGQQVPPEVYNALTYAGTAFLFTLSVPLILYGLNKLLNKIEDCFGCGPSSRKSKNKPTNGITNDNTSSNNNDNNNTNNNNNDATNDDNNNSISAQLQNQQSQSQLQQQQQIQIQLGQQLKEHSQLSNHITTTTHSNNNYNGNTNHNMGNISLLGLQQPIGSAQSKESTAITLPFEPSLNYKSTTIQHNLGRPFIIP